MLTLRLTLGDGQFFLDHDHMLYRSEVHEGRLKSDIYRTRTKIDILLMAITSGPWATSNGHQEDIDFSPSLVYAVSSRGNAE